MEQREYKLTDELIDMFISMNHYAEMRDKYVDSVWFQKKATEYGKKYWDTKQEIWEKFFELYPEALERNKRLNTTLKWSFGWDFVLENTP